MNHDTQRNDDPALTEPTPHTEPAVPIEPAPAQVVVATEPTAPNTEPTTETAESAPVLTPASEPSAPADLPASPKVVRTTQPAAQDKHDKKRKTREVAPASVVEPAPVAAPAATATPDITPTAVKVGVSKAAKATKAIKAVKPAKPTKVVVVREKLVRDSFTMPKSDIALIDALKSRALEGQRVAKKSELLRAGLHALNAMGSTALIAALEALQPIKTGRPKKHG